MPRSKAARRSRSACCRSERTHDIAMRADALVDLDDLLVQHRRQLDVPHEQLGSMLITDAQRVGEAARDRQHGAIALALEQRIGRNRRAHPHDVDRAGRNGLLADAEQLANALHGRVAVALRILRQQLERDERAVRLAADDIRERAAAIDPELPASGHRECRAEARPTWRAASRPPRPARTRAARSRRPASFEILIAPAAADQLREQVRIHRDVRQAHRPLRVAVEVAAEADVLDARDVTDVLDVIGDLRDRGRRHLAACRALPLRSGRAPRRSCRWSAA